MSTYIMRLCYPPLIQKTLNLTQKEKKKKEDLEEQRDGELIITACLTTEDFELVLQVTFIWTLFE